MHGRVGHVEWACVVRASSLLMDSQYLVRGIPAPRSFWRFTRADSLGQPEAELIPAVAMATLVLPCWSLSAFTLVPFITNPTPTKTPQHLLSVTRIRKGKGEKKYERVRKESSSHQIHCTCDAKSTSFSSTRLTLTSFSWNRRKKRKVDNVSLVLSYLPEILCVGKERKII